MVLAGMDAKIDRQYITDKMSVKHQAAGLKQINTATNNTYLFKYLWDKEQIKGLGDNHF